MPTTKKATKKASKKTVKKVTKKVAKKAAVKKQSGTDLAKYFDKVVLNVGVGRAQNSVSQFEDKVLPQIMKDIAAITGQKPHTRPSKKSIAGFKVREGVIVGVRVTLRGQRLVDFLSRLTRIVLPRVRDFGGVEMTKVDQGGALNMGLKEQYVFPEVDPEKSPFTFSLGLTAVPVVKDREKTLEVLKELKFPFITNEES